MLPSELRLEAAFRAWLRAVSLRAEPPTSLPDETLLSAMANDLDHAYGDDLWWQWPTWSTCCRCYESESAGCADCAHLAAFCWLAADERADTGHGV